MKIKKGDTVQIMTGKDRGKRGSVLRVDRKRNAILVEGLNLYKKHVRPKTQGAKGEIVRIAKPIPAANIRLFCKTCGRGVRVGVRVHQARAERYCKKCSSVV